MFLHITETFQIFLFPILFFNLLQSVNIGSSLLNQRKLLPHFIHTTKINVLNHHSFLFIHLRKHFAPRRCNDGISIRYISLALSCLGTSYHEHLIIQCSCPERELPVSRTRCHIKCSRNKDHSRTLLCGQSCKLRETDIVADFQSESSKLCIKCRNTVSCRQRIGLTETLSALHCNIKQMCLSVLADLLSFPVKHITGIVNMLLIIFLRHAACHQINLVLCCIL